jgi:hypothetical protein
MLDRASIVRRHNVIVTRPDSFAALTVGNGEFAFTVDTTGLQSFADEYESTLPLCTTSHWAWHTTPMPADLVGQPLRPAMYDSYGRAVGYFTDKTGQERLFDWRRQNPHRFHLGRIGFELRGRKIRGDDLMNVEQELDLFSGVVRSRFELENRPVEVITACHPQLDLVAVRVRSPLLADGAIRIVLAFPGASPDMSMASWSGPASHHTVATIQNDRQCCNFHRALDDVTYHATLCWSGVVAFAQLDEHRFELRATEGEELGLRCLFSTSRSEDVLPTITQTIAATTEHWEKFWTTGGAVDLTESSHPLAPELERRIVRSQYLTAIHCAGSLPSAETGLLCNSWFGKFHLEMHWWHCTHFVAWNRFAMFEQSLASYERLLRVARELAASQGYRGARWPKMIGPDGRDSPSPVGPLVVWQQPHPIYYAESCYRHAPTRATLDRWHDIVNESAEFMSSFATPALGPPLKTVSENTDPRTTTNPTFELAYWRFGLRVAQAWRERLGMPREARWDDVLARLAPLPVGDDNCYLMQGGMHDTYTRWNWEHPALLGALGVQPGDGVDPDVMRNTVRRVAQAWRWDRSWGWDFPMTAMAAARVNEPQLAIDFLMRDEPKNRYLPNGHNYQRPNLPAYLPGNGGLLAAIALMCAGWTDGPTRPAKSLPGFPDDGQWRVRYEGLIPWM